MDLHTRAVPPALPLPNDLIASHAGALRALALSLLGDEHAADDVLQETFVRAIESPPAARTSLSGWLRTVVRSVALDRLRSDSSRARREREIARHRPEASPHDGPERGEVLRLVVEEVLALEEPLRDCVLRRWFEGQLPREIAAATGTNVATVDARLQRAKALLRERLERRLGHRSGGWRAALAPLAWHDAPAPAPTPRATQPRPRTSPLLAASIGTLVGGGACAWWAFGDGTRERAASIEPAQVLASHASAPQPLATAGASSARRIGDVEVEASRRETSRLDGSARLGPGPHSFDVTFRVVDDAGVPVPGVDVAFAPRERPLCEAGATAWNGELRLQWLGFAEELDLVVSARQPSTARATLARVELVSGRPQTLVIALEPRAASSPFRIALGGIDATNGLVGTIRFGTSLVDPPGVFETDAAGNGWFVDPWLVQAHLRNASATPDDDADAGPSHLILSDVPFVTHGVEVCVARGETSFAATPVPSTASLEGRARDALGTTLVEARVVLLARELRHETRTDADGEFAFDDLPAGAADVWIDAERAGVERHALVLASGTRARIDVTVGTASVVRARLVDRDGAPLAQWRVEGRVRGGSTAGRVSRALTDARGEFELASPTGAALDVVARPEDRRSIPYERVASGLLPATGSVDLVASSAGAPASLRVLVRASPPALGSLERAELRVWRIDSGEGVLVDSSRDADGAETPAGSVARRVGGLLPGLYRAELRAPFASATSLGTIELAPGTESDLGVVELAPVRLVELAPNPVDGDDLELEARDPSRAVRSRPLPWTSGTRFLTHADPEWTFVVRRSSDASESRATVDWQASPSPRIELPRELAVVEASDAGAER